MKVSDLLPGDVLRGPTPSGQGTEEAVLIAVVTPNPIYPGLALVIWWMRREQIHSFDALSMHQEVLGEVVVTGGPKAERDARLHDAMGGDYKK